MGTCRFVECAETFTIRAHSALRSHGSAARAQRIAERAPRLKAATQSLSESSSIRPAWCGPTVLTRMLSSPQRWPSSAKAASTWLVIPTSTRRPTASGLPSSRNARTVSSRVDWVRPKIATLAPSAAKHSAVARPMPPVPPLTTAAAPRRPRSMPPASAAAERLVTVAVEVDHLADRTARGRAVPPARPAERDNGARRDRPRESQRAAGEERAPERHGDQRRTEPGGTCREEEVLHRGIDRAVVARGGDGREPRAEAAQASDHEDGNLGEVLGLPLDGVEDALHARIAAHRTASDRAVDAEHSTVETAEALLHRAVAYDDEVPVLRVRPRRRLERQLDEVEDERVVHRVGLQAADRPLRPHRVLERHREG